jgi:protocatechuate 3,4-dioxygenase beta subunit
MLHSVALCGFLLISSAAFTQPAAPQEKCVLAGRVINALTGEPVRKAEIHLDFANRKPGSTGPEGYGGIADASGQFRFEGVQQGEYTLRAERPGFLYSSYGAKAPNQAGTNLILAPGQQITDLSIRLFPQAVISGRVVDDDGDPVQSMVQIFAVTWKHGKQHLEPRGGQNTNDLGEYRLSNLNPGKYYLCAQSDFGGHPNELPAIPGKADVRVVRTFFPDAPSIDGAAPVQVQIGQSLTGIDIRLRTTATYHVRGRIGGSLQQASPQSMHVAISPANSGFTFSIGGSNVAKNGTFDLGGVAPGSYVLNVYGAVGLMRTIGRTPVEVTGSDVNGVLINVIASGTLRGRVDVEGGSSGGPASASGLDVYLQPVDDQMFGWGISNTKPDGTFQFENVSPSKYDLRVVNPPDGTYLKSVRLGQQEMFGKELDFTQGVAGELQITLAYGIAEVSGTVQMPQQDASSGSSSPKPATAASIVLVPEELRPDGSGIEYGNTTQAGTFTMKNVPPGRYRAYAMEAVKRDQMDNPDFLKQLESKGVEVDLKPNDKQPLQLTLIPATDTERILAQLGLDVQ